jgi:transcriptional regulator with GAF, ATPase, and Fis domain
MQPSRWHLVRELRLLGRRLVGNKQLRKPLQHGMPVTHFAPMNRSNQHAFRVYSAIPRQGKEDDWFEIGLAYPQPDGKGLVVLLQAQPFNPKLVLRLLSDARPSGERGLSLAQRLDAFERAVIEQCLMETGGKISAVMELLDVPRRTLSEKMARLGIKRRHFVATAAREHAHALLPGT